MENKIIYLPPVNDCSYFDIEANLAVHINECFTNQYVFRISKRLEEEELPLLTYDHAKKKWLTGRFIGKIYFTHDQINYCFEVTPRFGNATILHLLEEIFNIKLASTNSHNKLHNEDQNDLIKKLISIIWVKQLSKASIHGLPKRKIKVVYKGSTVKGRININRSLIPIYNEKNIISEYNERTIDEVVLVILFKAYKILIKHYFLSQNMLSESVIEMVHKSTIHDHMLLTKNQYEAIKYGSMYNNFKDIVDFSWNIIQRNRNNLEQKQSQKFGDTLFLDMAEIWEGYLMTIFKKKYRKEGWSVYSAKFFIYDKQSYRRGLIPDIIIEKDNNVVVFDAKYKRMTYNPKDYDRSDIFQIHTYGSYMEACNKKIIGLGLLYPVQEIMSDQQLQNNFSVGLFGSSTSKTWFKVDGIKLSDNREDLTIQKNAFLKRIEEKLSGTI